MVDEVQVPALGRSFTPLSGKMSVISLWQKMQWLMLIVDTLPSISVSACCQLVIRPPPHHVKPTPAPNVLYKRRGVARIEMSNLLGGCPYCPCSSENTAVVKHMYTKYCKEILLV